MKKAAPEGAAHKIHRWYDRIEKHKGINAFDPDSHWILTNNMINDLTVVMII